MAYKNYGISINISPRTYGGSTVVVENLLMKHHKVVYQVTDKFFSQTINYDDHEKTRESYKSCSTKDVVSCQTKKILLVENWKLFHSLLPTAIQPTSFPRFNQDSDDTSELLYVAARERTSILYRSHHLLEGQDTKNSPPRLRFRPIRKRDQDGIRLLKHLASSSCW